jgi:hypothetical protein
MRARDALGNISSEYTGTIIYAYTPPAAPTFLVNTTGITNLVYVMPQYDITDYNVNIYRNGDFSL